MTAVLTKVGTGRRWLSSVAEVVTERIANTKQRQRVRPAMKALPHLPYHLLRDVGLEQFAEPPDPIIRHRFL